MSLLVCALAELSSRFEGEVVDTTPGATTLEVVVVAPSRNPSNKLDISRSSGSNRLGKKTRASSRDYRAYGKENEITLSATTLGVVEIAPHMSASNKLGMNQSNG
jgi:hypothetical protein